MDMACVVIVTDADINERMLERADILGKHLDVAWHVTKTDIATKIVNGDANTFHTNYTADEVAEIVQANMIALQYDTHRKYNVVRQRVNESHVKLVNFDTNGNQFVIGEVVEYDWPNSVTFVSLI